MYIDVDMNTIWIYKYMNIYIYIYWSQLNSLNSALQLSPHRMMSAGSQPNAPVLRTWVVWSVFEPQVLEKGELTHLIS